MSKSLFINIGGIWKECTPYVNKNNAWKQVLECSVKTKTDWKPWKAEEHVHTISILDAVEATCEATGLTEGSYCTTCKEILVSQDLVPATGHNFSNWSEIKAPTENEAGTKRRTCQNCDFSEEEPVAALGHDHNNYEQILIPGKAATCTNTGLTDGYKCAGCGETIVEQQQIPATGVHDFDNKIFWSNDRQLKDEASCETDAIYYVECLNCTTHSSKTFTASECTEIRSTSEGLSFALGHSWKTPTYSWNGTTSCTATRVCSHDADHKETATSTSITNQITTAATCTTTGIKTYTAHFSKDWAGTPTTTETIDALNHSWGKWSKGTDPTEAATGTLIRTCTRNSNHTETFTLPKLDSTNYQTQTTEATCTEDGDTTYTYHKDGQYFNYKVTIPKLGHSYSEMKYEAREGNTHYAYRRCTVCGEDHSNSKVVDCIKNSDEAYFRSYDKTHHVEVTPCTVCSNTFISSPLICSFTGKITNINYDTTSHTYTQYCNCCQNTTKISGMHLFGGSNNICMCGFTKGTLA